MSSAKKKPKKTASKAASPEPEANTASVNGEAKKKKGRSLTAAERTELAALDASYESPIDRPVADIVQESRDLEALLKKVGKTLLKKSRLDKKTASSLPDRRKLLDRAEAIWTDHRVATLSKKLRTTRQDAEALKADAIHALRHFCIAEASVQARVDAIVLGSGLPDLIDDLKKLADLLDERASDLVKADLRANASKRARDYAESLATAAADRSFDPEGADAMAMRNRAYWWLREAMDAVRAAGRYVYRHDRKLLPAFRATSTRARTHSLSKSNHVDPKPPTGDGGSSHDN